MRRAMLLAMTALLLGVEASTNDLDVAREALRDELWSVARLHAGRVPTDEGKLIVIESYARENDWKGLLAACDAMGYPTREDFTYYRALALFKNGSIESASNMLFGTTFTRADLIRSAARLRAEMVRASNDVPAALNILETAGGEDVDTKLMKAALHVQAGRPKAAEKLWQSVASDTNASERARATAAAGLADTSLLETLSTNAVSSAVRCFASLKLGRALIRRRETFARGEKLIRETVRENPDGADAQASFLTLADVQLKDENYAAAEQTYAHALTIWPSLAKNAVVHSGRGWALFKTGQKAEALDEFRQAEALADTDNDKADAATALADVLSALGRTQDAADAYEHVRTAYPRTAAAARVADVIRLRDREESGRALYRAFKFTEAQKAFEELAKDDVANRERLLLYSVRCRYGAGDDASAEHLARTLARDAKDPSVRSDATLWLAKFDFNHERWHEAKEHFAAFADAAPASSDAPMALVWSARAALADRDYKGVISNVTLLVTRHPNAPACAAGQLAQGEALIELGRFDEALLVLDRAALVADAAESDRLNARILRADALFAMGADNPTRYKSALDAYNAIRTDTALSPSAELSTAFKVAKTLEKLKRPDEAEDTYYTHVILAYRTGRIAGIQYDETAQANFTHAAFHLAEECENRGRIRQAVHVLSLVQTSDVPAAEEAQKRIHRIYKKGMPQ